jgi:hypothetical protein
LKVRMLIILGIGTYARHSIGKLNSSLLDIDDC